MMFQCPARCGVRKKRKKDASHAEKRLFSSEGDGFCCCSCQGNLIYVRRVSRQDNSNCVLCVSFRHDF